MAAQLLNPELVVTGVTAGSLLQGLSAIAVPRGTEYELKGWGYRQISRAGSNIVMPATGDAKQRDWSADERQALIECGNRHGLNEHAVFEVLGSTAYDVSINESAFWQGVPASVWNRELGGYIVLRKWLSYRDGAVLGRQLKGTEVLHFSGIVRRLTELMLLGPALDLNYAECRSVSIDWKDGRPVEPETAAVQ